MESVLLKLKHLREQNGYSQITEEMVLQAFVEIQVVPSLYPQNLGARRIADALSTSEYQVRKHIKSLVDKGLLVYCHEGGCSEDGKVWCMNGYYITPQVQELPVYKYWNNEMMKYLSDLCNGRYDNEQA